MEFRNPPNSLIEYIIISDGSPLESFLIPPEIFMTGVLNFLKLLPKDLLQLVDAVKYYEYQLMSSTNIGYDIKIINIKDFSIVSENINHSNRLQLFFLNGKKEDHVNLFYELINFQSSIKFFYYYKKSKDTIDNKNIIKSPSDFITKILENESEILKILNIEKFKLNFSIPINYKKIINFSYFVPTQNNIFSINSIIGNFCYYNSETRKEIKKKHKEITNKALQNRDTFNRQEIFLNQLNDIDFHSNVAYKHNLIKRISQIEPIFSPLILVAPFHNPDIDIEDKNFKYLISLEQNSNYIVDGDPKKASVEEHVIAMRFHKIRLNYLDDVAFLHSSFNFSPTLRLPIKGKSIYRELSFFAPKSFNVYLNRNSRKKLQKTINTFGKKLSELTFSKNILKKIKNRNSQIIVISDLPIEWLNIDSIPLSFTHDVCRLPETTLHGLMSFYVSNQNFKFTIKKNILEKTLVILGCHDSSFSTWHTDLFHLQKQYNFNVIECFSNHDVKNAIEKFKPDLLIFDCHGGFDSVTNSSYLEIGSDILDSKYIVENNIFAPIVFLSACGTAPTYGTNNPIANAFFQAGSLSVTSTFLPISIDSGSILYLRLLNKLDYASKNIIHKNWLEFVCHIIRTSTINDAYMYALNKYTQISKSDFQASNIDSLIDSLQFEKRRKLFYELDKKITLMTKVSKDHYSSQIPEYLLYTNLGRGDLIQFENWIEENSSINLNSF
jgi:hypothetical protein